MIWMLPIHFLEHGKMSLLRKLTTKPVWLWERHRPRPIRNAWHRLSRLDVRPNSSLHVNILCTADSLSEAAWSAWSWTRYAGEQLSVRIVVDGTWDQGFLEAMRRVLPRVEIVELDDLLNEDVAADKTLSAFGAQHPLGRKLLLMLSLQQADDFIYSDSDVLLFSRPDELLRAVDLACPVYNRENTESSYDSDILEAAKSLAMPPCERFNSGLIYCKRGDLDVLLAVRLLQMKGARAFSWFDEQTIMAVLMQKAGATPLSSDLYVVSPRRQFWWDKDVDYSSIHSRHFTGTVRHLMYSKGYQVLRSTRGKQR